MCCNEFNRAVFIIYSFATCFSLYVKCNKTVYFESDVNPSSVSEIKTNASDINEIESSNSSDCSTDCSKTNYISGE